MRLPPDAWGVLLCHLEGRLGEALRLSEAMAEGGWREACRGLVLASIGAAGEAGTCLERLEGSGDVPGLARAVAAWAEGLAAGARGDPAAGQVALGDAQERFGQGGQEVLAHAVGLDRALSSLGRSGDGDESPGDGLAGPAAPAVDSPAVLAALAGVMAARSRRRRGRAQEALDALQALADQGLREGWPRLREVARGEAARAAEGVGDATTARRHAAARVEALEEQALALPPVHRKAFWAHPDRGAPRPARAADGEAPSFHRPGLELRTARLLDILERLTAEHDLDRLLERITDSAVELTGAERGFVLLVDDAGQLEPEPRLARARGTRTEDPSVRFSRSIAEAVLIDGEPIVSVDATDDRRLAEYLSVHHLQLRSVACLPIRNRAGTEGVLYLEHRIRRGRFREADLSLLRAFAHQAAIALSNARLLAENGQRRRELEDNNRQLARAKAELEHAVMTRTAELEEARHELDRVLGGGRTDYERHGIVGRSGAIRRVFAVVDRVRETHVPVVVCGESGTGKELVARAIHYAGLRAKGPFVAVNCAAIPEALLESELFGHVRGAFTGADRDRRGVLARASGGTLFLDEVGEMPPKMQVELLRVLTDGKVRPVGGETEMDVDVRIVAAAQRPLGELVERGRFREDLFYRLDVVEVRLPPLRERIEDIPLLCQHFLRRFEREGMGARRLSRGALETLCGHPLPGNVRQLEHLLLNACVLAEGEVIDEADLPLKPGDAMRVVPPPPSPADPDVPGNLAEFKGDERRRILDALEKHTWNRAKAARALGMPRRTFYRRLREHGIQ
ncbi:MAG: sigma 54-interacting transcriptional regulator [Myxococcota bacterium]